MKRIFLVSCVVGGCGGSVEAPADADIAFVAANRPLRGEVVISSSPAARPGRFAHVLAAQLPGHGRFRDWPWRAEIGPCEIVQHVSAEGERPEPAAQRNAGTIDVVRAFGKSTPLLSLDWEDGGYAAVAREDPRWTGGEELFVRARGGAATPGAVEPFEARIRQASAVTVVEPAETPPTRPSPFSGPPQLYRVVKVSPQRDFVVRWTGWSEPDEVVVTFGGSESIEYEYATARPAGARSRWAICHARGSEITIPRDVIAAVRRVATAYCELHIASRSTTSSTASGLSITVETWMHETAAASAPALVDFE